VAHWKKNLSEFMMRMGVSMDGVNGEILSLKNSAKSGELSIKGLNNKYTVVERNLAILEKWSVSFEFDRKFLENDVTVIEKHVNGDSKASQGCSASSVVNSFPPLTSASTPSLSEASAGSVVADMFASPTCNPVLSQALTIEEFETQMKSFA